MKKTLEYYMSLEYPISLIKEDGCFIATIPDLPGCMSDGDTLDEAYDMILDAKKAWIETAIEMGKEIPEPKIDSDYSGKFVFRTTKSFHKKLAEQAKKEGVSLNQYVNLLISEKYYTSLQDTSGTTTIRVITVPDPHMASLSYEVGFLSQTGSSSSWMGNWMEEITANG